MNGFAFYAEMPSEWKSKSGCKSHQPFTRRTLAEWAERNLFCNVAAVARGKEYRLHDGSQECISALSDYGDSPVCTSSVSRDYLDKRCIRISEELARKLHPSLFRRLDESGS